MKKQEIIDKVNAAMAAKAGIDAASIKPDDLYDELGADSMKCMEALVEIEDEFCITIPGVSLLGVRTMQDAYDLVGRVVADTFGFQLY